MKPHSAADNTGNSSPLPSPPIAISPSSNSITSVALLFFVLLWAIDSAVHYKGTATVTYQPPIQTLFNLFSVPSPPPLTMSQSSSYVRCDLLPKGPLPDSDARATCTEYIRGSPGQGQ